MKTRVALIAAAMLASAVTREEREKFHEEMKQEMTTKLQGVLTPEQMKKFDALMDHPHGPPRGQGGWQHGGQQGSQPQQQQ
jgi:hypothetical protein